MLNYCLDLCAPVTTGKTAKMQAVQGVASTVQDELPVKQGIDNVL